MTTPPGAHPAGASRAELVAAVRDALGGLGEGTAVVVALSGGPDSTALAYLAAEARDDLRLTLAHVRHGLRDDAEDIEVVRRHADWLGVALEIREVEVDARGEGLEAAARRVRYRALREVAQEVGAAVILVGHTAEDQAETLLLRLARGTGLDGLRGMRPRTGDLLRPLLRLRREDVHRFVLLEGLPSVDDPQNRDPDVRRSVVRQRLLPALAEVAPDPVAALTRLAGLAHDDAAALDGLVAQVLAGARRVGPVIAVRRAPLDEGPVALARRVVRALVAEAGGGPPPSAAAVTRVLDLAPGGGVDLPRGVRATAGGGWLAVTSGDVPSSPAAALAPGSLVAWPPAGIAVRWHEAGDQAAVDDGQIALELAGVWRRPRVRVPDRLLPPGGRPDAATTLVAEGVPRLWLRDRRPGDRLVLTGGTRRLSDVYVDAGVPRPVRARWPVVVDDEDRIVWVPGVARDHEVARRAARQPGGLLALDRPGPAGADPGAPTP
jgi:tRNA(Ile)-lysidine synthase